MATDKLDVSIREKHRRKRSQQRFYASYFRPPIWEMEERVVGAGVGDIKGRDLSFVFVLATRRLSFHKSIVSFSSAAKPIGYISPLC